MLNLKFLECLKKSRKKDNYKKKKRKLLTNKQQESYEKTKICYIEREKFEDKFTNVKKILLSYRSFLFTREYRGAAYVVIRTYVV